MGTRRTKIVWLSRADNDIDDIHRYIAKDSTLRATTVVRIIRQKPNVLKTFPGFGQVVQGIGRNDIRELYCFSWRVLYQYIEEDKTVYIISVFHSARELNENVINEIFEEGRTDEHN
jgi:plasmid stabilization system protein ParE